MAKTNGMLAASVAWVLLTGVVSGAEPDAPPAVAEANGFTVELLHVAVTRPLPSDLSNESRPVGLGEPGLVLTLVLRGNDIARLKDGGLKLDVLRTKSGRDLLTGDKGSDEYRLEPQGSEADTYRVFKVVCPAAAKQFDGLEIDGLEVGGTLTVVVAEATELLKTDVLDLTKKSDEKIRLDGYEIGLQGESTPGGMFAEIGTAFGEAPDRKFLSFSLRGKHDEIEGIDVVVGGKKLLWREHERFFGRATYAYLKDGDGRGTIEIRRWKNLHDVVVPFRCRPEPQPQRTAEQAVPQDAGGGAYTTELVQISAGRPGPVEAPESGRPTPNRESGFDMKFLVRGPDIAEIKTFDGTLDVLRTKDGRDIRLRDGKINYRVWAMHNFGKQPKHHFFEVTSDEPLFGVLDGLEVRGAVTVVAARGRTTVTSEAIDFSKPGSITLGEWTIPYRVEEGERTSYQMMPHRTGAQQSAGLPPTIEQINELELSPIGDGERIIEVEVLVDGQPIQMLGASYGAAASAAPRLVSTTRSSPVAASPAPVPMPSSSFRFEKPTGRGVVRITYWKERREVRVPFRHNLPAGDK